MDEFPSGQRGQTVNLLQVASMVRIHPHPPFFKRGRIAQLGEHLPYKQGVTGSSPVVPTIKNNIKIHICWHGSTVEQLTCNQQVVGSIPIASSING